MMTIMMKMMIKLIKFSSLYSNNCWVVFKFKLRCELLQVNEVSFIKFFFIEGFNLISFIVYQSSIIYLWHIELTKTLDI